MDINTKLSDFRSNLIVALATKFHYLIIFCIIAGLTLTVVIQRPDYAIRGIIYIVPGILLIIFLLTLYSKGEKYPDTFTLIHANRKFFQIVFVSLFILSILALYFSSYRPWYYFLLITGLFCVIFLQIFEDKINPSIILFELSCVMGNLIFGLHLKYPLYFGLSDIIPHLYFSKIIFLSGHLIPGDLDRSYAWFPLYHIFIAQGTNLLGIDVKFAFIILTSLSFIVVLWVIYLLFYQITKNNQTSLMICLFFSTTPVVITYSTYVVTRVMAFIGFFFLLFLAHKQIQSSKWRSLSLLILLFSLYLILVHQVSILQILFVLFLFIILEVIINDYFAVKTKIIAFIILTFSTYWIFTSVDFFKAILERGESANTPVISTLKVQIAGYEYSFLENNITTAISIFFVVLGVGYIFWAYRSKYPSVIGLFVLIMCPVYFPSPLTASKFAQVTFRIDRFELLISPFFAFASAMGFLFLLYTFYKNKSTKKIALVFGLLIFSYLCFSALTGGNASDSPDLSINQSRGYFTESEMNSFDFISQYVRYNSTITSDTSSSRMFEKEFFSKTKALNLPSFNTTSRLESNEDTLTFDTGFFILRNQELGKNGLYYMTKNIDLTKDWYGKNFEPSQDNLLKFSDMTYSSQKIYENRRVTILSNLR